MKSKRTTALPARLDQGQNVSGLWRARRQEAEDSLSGWGRSNFRDSAT